MLSIERHCESTFIRCSLVTETLLVVHPVLTYLSNIGQTIIFHWCADVRLFPLSRVSRTDSVGSRNSRSRGHSSSVAAVIRRASNRSQTRVTMHEPSTRDDQAQLAPADRERKSCSESQLAASYVVECEWNGRSPVLAGYQDMFPAAAGAVSEPQLAAVHKELEVRACTILIIMSLPSTLVF